MVVYRVQGPPWERTFFLDGLSFTRQLPTLSNLSKHRAISKR